MDKGAPRRETDPLDPFPEPYAVTKAEGDRLVRRMVADEGLPAVIIRPGTFFGPGDQLHFNRIADRLRAGRGVIVGRGDNELPLGYVTDIVQGLVLALDHDDVVGEAFNITNDVPLTQRQLFEAIATEIDARPPWVHVPYSLLYAAGGAAERIAEAVHSTRQPPLTRLGVNVFGTTNRHAIDKAREQLGYAPRVALREGIRLAAAHYLKAEAMEAAASTAMTCPNCGVEAPADAWNCPGCRINLYWAVQHFDGLAEIRDGQGRGEHAGSPSFLVAAHRHAMDERAARGAPQENKVRADGAQGDAEQAGCGS